MKPCATELVTEMIPMVDVRNINSILKRSLTVIVKPIVDCNLSCTYCYEGSNPYSGQKMVLKTLENIVSKFCKYGDYDAPVNFIWHGGEPLLMGLDFYEKAFEFEVQYKGDRRIRNAMQSNGTLFNAEYADLFKKMKLSYGISLDGPKRLHDKYRIYEGGQGTHDDVLKAVRLAKQTLGKPFGVLATMTRFTIEEMESAYAFFDAEGLNFKMNPLFYEGRGKEARAEIHVGPKELGVAMSALFDKWYNSKDTKIYIEPFDELIRNIVFGVTESCIFSGDCHSNYYTVAPNGDLYLCGQWPFVSINSGFCLGNINTDELDVIFRSDHTCTVKQQRSFSSRKCSACTYSSICNSGCYKQSYMIKSDPSDKDYYCDYYKTLYKHIHNTLLAEDELVCATSIDDIKLSEINNPVLKNILEQAIEKLTNIKANRKGEAVNGWHTEHSERWSENYSCCVP